MIDLDNAFGAPKCRYRDPSQREGKGLMISEMGCILSKLWTVWTISYSLLFLQLAFCGRIIEQYPLKVDTRAPEKKRKGPLHRVYQTNTNPRRGSKPMMTMRHNCQGICCPPSLVGLQTPTVMYS
jgi:hypothetical protein